MSRRTKRTERPLDSPAVTSGPAISGDGPQPDARTQLANRVALLTFLTAFAIVVTLVVVPRALDGGGAIARILAVAVPLAAAAAALALRKARAALRATRDPRDVDVSAPAGE